MKILLVEDDEFLTEMLQQALTQQHHAVETVADGQIGWQLVEAFDYDLILLDVMLPGLDGVSFCRKLRLQNNLTPVILLTALDNATNRISGLDAGADDYIVKPFDLQELLARIRALLRRGQTAQAPLITWNDLQLNPSSCGVTYRDRHIHLTSKEYRLLELFLRNEQRIFSQSALLDQLWSIEGAPMENTVRAHIRSLRQKLKQAGCSDPIETVYGLGYRLRPRQKPPEPCPSAPPAAASAPLIAPQLIKTWERYRGTYRDRLSLIQRAVAALMTHTLDPQLQQQAMQEAHTLAGSIGSFGLEEISQICHQVEQLLALPTTPDLSQAEQIDLAQKLAALEQFLAAAPSRETRPTLPSSSHLLIVTDNLQLAEAVTRQASAEAWQADLATTLATARTLLHRGPTAVLLDFKGLNPEDGFELLSELAAAKPVVPVVVLAQQQSFADRVKIARLGGRVFLQSPTSVEQIMGAIAQLVQPSPTEATLLIVDDDLSLLDFLHNLLQPWGFCLHLLQDPRQFWEVLEQAQPDLLILDMVMPEFSGLDLCQVVRNDCDWHSLPILFLSARTDPETIHQVFMAGADDYVRKPVVGPELVARILNRLKRAKP